MQVQTEKEIHAASSGCNLTMNHWGGESEALFSLSTNSLMGCRWLSCSTQDWVVAVAGRGHGQDLGLILCHLMSLAVVGERESLPGTRNTFWPAKGGRGSSGVVLVLSWRDWLGWCGCGQVELLKENKKWWGELLPVSETSSCLLFS